jgi:Fe-S-cluster containining protein
VTREVGPGAGERLCTACGLCCSGAVLSGVIVRGEEVAWARRRRLHLVETPVGWAFAHPCPLLDGTRCSDYEDRPGACRRFACKLLSSVERGEASIDEALAEVASLRAAVDAISDRVEPARRARLWQLSTVIADATTEPAARAAAEAELSPLLADVRELRARIDRVIISPEQNAASRKS